MKGKPLLNFFAVSGIIIYFIFSFTASGEAQVQKKGENTRRGREQTQKNVKKAETVKPGSARRVVYYDKTGMTLVGKEMLADVLDMGHISMETDETEYKQIYRPLAESIKNFSENMKKVVASVNNDYYTFRVKYSSKFSAEMEKSKKMIAANRDPGRAESLASLQAIIVSDQREVIKKEAQKVREKVDSVFDLFLQVFNVQKKIMVSGTAYENRKNFSSGLDSFEVRIKSKHQALIAHIEAKFSSLEVELIK